MSLFAILLPERQLTVDRLDIIVSCLPALGGRRNFTCDVGVAFTSQTPLSELELCLPFGFRKEDIEDLGHHLADPVLASLIFAARCDITREDIGATKAAQPGDGQQVGLTQVIRFADYVLAVNYVDLDRCRRADDSTRSLSRLVVGLLNPVKPGVTYYVRFRLPVLGFGRAWTSQRMVPFLVPATATLDFRVADVWEAAGHDAEPFQTRIAPIRSVDVAVATSIDYRFLRASPEPTRARVLESARWFDYMGRRVTFMGRGKLVVTSWAQKAVSTSNPVRIYASVRRDTRLVKLLELLRVAIASIIGVLLVVESDYWADGALAHVVSALGDAYYGLPGQWILPSGLAGLAALLVMVAERYPKMRSVLSRIDRWFYNIGRR